MRYQMAAANKARETAEALDQRASSSTPCLEGQSLVIQLVGQFPELGGVGLCNHHGVRCQFVQCLQIIFLECEL